MVHTVAMDRMGSLHIWNGKVSPIRVGKYQYDAPVSSIYLQSQVDVAMVLDSLAYDTQDSLQNGYIVSVVDNHLLEKVCNAI